MNGKTILIVVIALLVGYAVGVKVPTLGNAVGL